jgi:hypothetical protein
MPAPVIAEKAIVRMAGSSIGTRPLAQKQGHQQLPVASFAWLSGLFAWHARLMK